ncbi:DNA polymerase III subunit gamma/tau [Aliikangiella marina]|uniref:DNA polymerase III subunit gamma/tau n=1 Tax=Aliikangiella marina TaxID=1712262 RepID=A0A545TJQ0_9GAMM|nr:DNA polymerase III subunit gamma/tau [Aliikangiella marina]TQV77454.1 DNA polymerase III subunit gamma/tau [Aliikangiella marina]
MSYQVLARKWRPKDFSELVGQQQTAQALINALESQRLHHAYLFTGTRGVGKTTIARILSKSLNCETGITSTPCGECASCVEINQGNFVDLLEIDAASKTKVEDTRELLDNVQYRPTRGRYKVYLIDEVHMLSGHSFNALLKTLEEPPPHVIFLLATTDPQKMPVTVLSRCLQFHLRRMEEPEIISHLSHILEAENIPFEMEALPAIAKGADGSMRDALSLLDQAIAYCGDNIKAQVVLDMLGTLDRDYSFQLLEAIESGDAKRLIEVIENIAQFSPDFNELIGDWLSLLHQIAVSQATQSSDDPKVLSWSNQINAADLQLYYQLSLQAKRDLVYAPHPRQGFEMAMLRIMAFKPATKPPGSGNKSPENKAPEATQIDTDPGPSPSKNQSVNVESGANNLTHSAMNPVESQPVASLNIASKSQSNVALAYDEHPQLSADENVKSQENDVTAHLSKAEQIKQIIKQPAKLTMVVDNEVKNERQAQQPIEPADRLASIESQSQQSETVKTIAFEDVTENEWFHVVAGLNLTGHGLQVLSNATANYQNGKLIINPLSRIESLLTPSAQDNILSALKSYFKQDHLPLSYEFVEQTSETPRERLARLHELAIDEANSELQNDPQIKFLMEKLSATLPRESIQLKK